MSDSYQYMLQQHFQAPKKAQPVEKQDDKLSAPEELKPGEELNLAEIMKQAFGTDLIPQNK